MDKAEQSWNEALKQIHESGKPCHTLLYCPYGPLVEEFPLLGPTRKESIDYIENVKDQLQKGTYNKKQTVRFEKEVKEFNLKDYPIEHSKEALQRRCTTFGHDCPVFHAAEPMAEDEAFDE